MASKFPPLKTYLSNRGCFGLQGNLLAAAHKLKLIIPMNLGLIALMVLMAVGLCPALRGDQSPPPAPPVLTKEQPDSGSSGWGTDRVAASALIEWSIGEPSDEEQYYLELVNRTRMDPLGEATRLAQATDPAVLGAYKSSKVNLIVMSNDIALLPIVAPLAMNKNLSKAALGHTKYMFDNKVQTHDEPGFDLGKRATAAGYDWTALGESVFAYARSVYHGYAAFEVDWGDTNMVNGLQNPPGHRLNNHNAKFHEVGIGVVLGTNGAVGPQLVTMDFGNGPSDASLMTGVVYYDLNDNGYYDQGEGVGGVRVDVSGSGYFATTAASGGYAVPCANGLLTVAFSSPYMAETNRTVSVADNKNAKADLKLKYTPPSLYGPTLLGLGVGYIFTFPPVLGALSYEWRAVRHEPYTFIEGAETGTNNVVLTTSPGYSPIASDTQGSGAFSFHLAHSKPVDQILGLKPKLRGNSSSQIQFSTRLGLSTNIQTASLQISMDEGNSWTILWSQSGTGGNGEGAFTRRTNSLSAFSGRDLLVRFVYGFSGSGNYFPQSGAGQGFYLDDISFTNTEVLSGETSGEVPSGKFTITEMSLGNLWVQVRPKVNQRRLPYGPVLSVQAVASVIPPSIRISAAEIQPNGLLRIAFKVLLGDAQTLSLETAGELGGVWSDAAGSTLSTPQSGDYFFSVIPSQNPGFFRVRAQ